MEKETKKYLIIGTALVVSIGIGVVLWKKYQTTSTASNAASDQSNQDELALLESSLEANAYAGESGAESYSPAVVGSGTPQTLAEEVTSLENALGFGPPPTTTPTTPTPTTPTTPITPAPAPTNPPATPPATGSPTPVPTTPETELANGIQYLHGSPVLQMDGVPGEGIPIQ